LDPPGGGRGVPVVTDVSPLISFFPMEAVHPSILLGLSVAIPATMFTSSNSVLLEICRRRSFHRCTEAPWGADLGVFSFMPAHLFVRYFYKVSETDFSTKVLTSLSCSVRAWHRRIDGAEFTVSGFDSPGNVSFWFEIYFRPPFSFRALRDFGSPRESAHTFNQIDCPNSFPVTAVLLWGSFFGFPH